MPQGYHHETRDKRTQVYALNTTGTLIHKISAIVDRHVSTISRLEKYKSYFLNYFKKRKNSGFVEGMNSKIKVAKRRCYRFSGDD